MSSAGRLRARLLTALTAVYRWLPRHALGLVAVATATVLAVVLYLPVGLIFADALFVDGQLSVENVTTVLTDPFYFGPLASVFAEPLAIGTHLRSGLEWALAGFPSVRQGLFGFTAYQAVLSTLASLALGLPAAYILATYDFRGRDTLRSLTIIPFVLPGIMVAVGFFAMFGTRGTLNGALGVVGVGPYPFIERHTLAVIVLAHAFYNAPLITRITVAAWESVDIRTLETARSLGAGPRRAFIDVVVPQLYPAILTGALLSFLFTFMTFPIVLAVGGLQFATVEVWIYTRIRQLDFTEAATLALLETTISLAVTYAYLRYESAQTGLSRASSPPPREPLFPTRWSLFSPQRLALCGYGVLALVIFVGPLASTVIGSVTDGSGLTLSHYAFLLERQAAGAAYQVQPWPAVRNSLLFGVGTLCVALPMGVVIAVLTNRSGRRWRVIDTLTMLPLAVSGIVFGIGLLRGLVFGISLPFGWRLRVTGVVAILAAHAVAAYPFVTRTVSPLLGDLDPRLVDSARALGASRLRALLDIELPLVAGGIIAGAAFAFAISIGEFSSTVILASSGDIETMPVAIERFLDRRPGPAIAMGTILLAATATSVLVIDRVGGDR